MASMSHNIFYVPGRTLPKGITMFDYRKARQTMEKLKMMERMIRAYLLGVDKEYDRLCAEWARRFAAKG